MLIIAFFTLHFSVREMLTAGLTELCSLEIDKRSEDSELYLLKKMFTLQINIFQ